MYSRWIMITGSRILLGLLSVFLLFPLSPLRADETAAQIDLAVTADVSIIGRTAGESVRPGTLGSLSGVLRAIVADVSGDRVGDLIIGAPLADPSPNPGEVRKNAGAVYVIFGRAGLASPTLRDLETQPPDITIYGASAGDGLGSALAAGDVNRDQVRDIIIGAPLADAPNKSNVGKAYVIFGGQNLAPSTTRDMASSTSGPDVTITGWGGPNGRHEDFAGSSVASGDVNADGVDDMIVGAPGLDGNNGNRVEGGAIYVFFGQAGLARGTMRDASQPTPAAGGVNMLIFGRAVNIPIRQQDAGGALGAVVATGDVNGDGATDIITAAALLDLRTINLGPGEVYGIFGSSTLSRDTATVVDVSPGGRYAGSIPANFTITGAESGDTAGQALAVGNVNGDRFDDIIIGTPMADGPSNGRPDAGEVYIIFGATTLANRNLSMTPADVTIVGVDQADQLGFSLAVGDLDPADPAKDLVMAAPTADGPGNNRDGAGEVYVLRGPIQSTGSPTVRDLSQNAPDVTIIGAQVADQVGLSVAVGDFNGNRGDVIATSPFADGSGTNPKTKAGVTYVIFRGGI